MRTDAQVKSSPFEPSTPDRGADQQRHRQVRPPAPPPRGASARPAALRDAEKIPPALQGRRRPGHPLPRHGGGSLCGAAAAHLRRASGLTAGYRADEEPRRGLHRRADEESRRLPFLGVPVLLPHRRTAAGRGRDPDRHVGRNVHEPPFAGRRGQRQNVGGCCGHLACIRAGYQAALLAPTEILPASTPRT